MIMKYKNYIASVELDDSVDMLHGRVRNTRDIITFEGRTVKELRRAFADSVAEYEAFCKERGEEPERPYSGRFVVRLDPEIHAAIAAKAAERDESINDYVKDALAHALEPA
jgi:predicted HicB family RNase H-like nuclease